MAKTDPTLTQAFACLRRPAEAPTTHACLPPALHALIIATLARLFARLEQLFLLWQSGQLPPQRPGAPPIARPAPNTPHPGTSRTARPGRQYTRARRATFRAPSPRPTPTLPGGIRAPKPPLHARAPPPPRHPIRRNNRPARIADPRAISLRYQLYTPPPKPYPNRPRIPATNPIVASIAGTSSALACDENFATTISPARSTNKFCPFTPSPNSIGRASRVTYHLSR